MVGPPLWKWWSSSIGMMRFPRFLGKSKNGNQTTNSYCVMNCFFSLLEADWQFHGIPWSVQVWRWIMLELDSNMLETAQHLTGDFQDDPGRMWNPESTRCVKALLQFSLARKMGDLRCCHMSYEFIWFYTTGYKPHMTGNPKIQQINICEKSTVNICF